MKNEPIDIFVTWVDDSDPKWIAEKNKYDGETYSKKGDKGEERYRSWDNFHYWFRGVEKNMPWINKIFLVTCGQVPPFLNINHPKLRLINHEDYMPHKYLPTFNSRAIELNLFRIDELSENFILFNDDFFVIDNLKEEYFFRNNKVCEEAIERVIGCTNLVSSHVYMNNAWVINKYFNKKKVKKDNFTKWYNPCYGKGVFRNLYMNYFHTFEMLKNPHEPSAMKKSTLKKLWELEPEMLDITSSHKFRSTADVNQYLIRYWEIFEGDFIPRLHKGCSWTIDDKNYMQAASDIRNRNYPLISIDEPMGRASTSDIFEMMKKEINAAFEEIFPGKSSFEI